MIPSLVHIAPVWREIIKAELHEKYMVELMTRLAKEKKRGLVMCPKLENLFNAFVTPDLPDVRVVILGQDPYPRLPDAIGKSFAIPPETSEIPSSLSNIIKELKDDLDIELEDTSLSHWNKQGVLTLNTRLSTVDGKVLAHKNIGWERFTKEVLQNVSDLQHKVIFVAWGKEAREFVKRCVDLDKHELITSAHPCRRSASRGFFGSKPFSKVNKFLGEDLRW